MRAVIRDLVTGLQQGRAVAYCRLVETRGSTPQKAGAVMLVYADGSQAGTLGGGCVEAEVKRRALAVLNTGQAEIATFQLDSDYGWDDGLICGGRMQIFVQPLLPGAQTSEYYERLGQLIDAGQGITEAIVFDAEKGNLPATSCYLFDADDQVVAVQRGSISEVPTAITAHLRPLSSRPRAYAAQGIAYLPVHPRCRLIIVGGGHVGQSVANLAADLEFDVWVVDDRESIVSEDRFPSAERRIAGEIEQVLTELDVTSDSYCLIVTRGHNHDEQALYHLINRDARYLGMIGSRRKIRMIFEDLVEEGIDPALLERVHAPVGLDIGSQSVPEIAVSICAELVSHRNRDGIVPGRPQRVELSAEGG